MATNWKKLYAIQAKNRDAIKKACPKIDDKPGIYFFTRTDENGISYFYIGQAVKLLDRCAQHLSGFQHIDLSLKKRGLYSENNVYGWKLNFLHYPKDELDKMEQHWILEYTKQGYQCRYNKTGGSQGVGKEKINEYRPAKGYHDGLKQGYRNASKEIAHLINLHLVVTTKQNPPTKLQMKALEKFNDFLNFSKKEEIEDGEKSE